MIMFIAIIIVFNENVLRSKCVIKDEDEDFLDQAISQATKERSDQLDSFIKNSFEGTEEK